jgi:GT2 family glycosyltransferase
MISVVVVNWNSGPLLERCVSSLTAHAPGCEIIIVDNASTDGSEAFARKDAPAVRLISREENAGFAAACNAGWRQSAGDPVLFLNPDAECLPGAIGRLADAFSDAAVWAAGGSLMDEKTRARQDCNVRAFPCVASAAAELLLLDEVWPRNRWTRAARLLDRRLDEAQDVDQPAAACLMVRREALQRLEGFDEQFYPAWFEDVDLCRRIVAAGGRIRFEPEARFLHRGGYSAERLRPEDFLLFFHTNQVRYFQKHHGEAAAKKLRKLVAAGMYVRMLASFVFPARNGHSRHSLACAHWRVARHFAKGPRIP